MTLFTKQISKSYSRVFVYVATVMLVASLHACGFQLRGAIDLSGDISPIYIEQNSVFNLAREIRSLLATNNIKVVEDVKKSKAQLTLLSEEKSRRVLSVDGSGRAREYLLLYKVNFVIKIKPSEPPAVESVETENIEAKDKPDSISHDSISVARNLVFDPDAVLAVTNEAEISYNDMRRDVARLILLKLEARSKSKVIKNNSDPTQAESTDKR